MDQPSVSLTVTAVRGLEQTDLNAVLGQTADDIRDAVNGYFPAGEVVVQAYVPEEGQ